MDPPPSGDFGSVNRMSRHFASLLKSVAKHHASRKPLVVVIDGLDSFGERHRPLSVLVAKTTATSRLPHSFIANW